MTNRTSEARIPYTPGDWLRIFRTRHAVYTTPEALGAQIGVSGKTIVRWENGQSHPRKDDLETFSQVLRLSPMQRAFLLRAFSTVKETHGPDAAAYEAHARQLLASPFPAILLDGLFYVRGRNGLAVSTFFPHAGPIAPNSNFLGRLIQLRQQRNPDVDLVKDPDVHLWLQLLWISTATLCGLSGYRSMLDELSALPDFRDAWIRAAVEPGRRLAGAPDQVTRNTIEEYRAYTSPVDFPPIYHLREYVPTNDAAREHLEEIRRSQPPGVELAAVRHWTEM